MLLAKKANRGVLNFFACIFIFATMAFGGIFGTMSASVAETYNITLENVSALPSGYTQLEYLESTGTQYIDTGIKNVVNSEFDLTAQLTSLSGGNTMLGALDGTTNGETDFKLVLAKNSSSYYQTQCAHYGNYIITSVPVDTQKHTFKITNTTNSQTVVIDNGTPSVGSYAVTSKTNTSLYVFARNNNGSPNNYVSMKLYALSVKQNDVITHNFIPARRNSDNVLGLYDTVTNTFKTNSGTGTFTAGNPATDSTTSTYTVGVGATINEVPTRDGYVFAGWCTDSALTNCAMTQTIGTSDTGDKTFYAKWTINQYSVTYSCGDADGTAPSGTTVTYGSSFTPAANPCSKTGHTFAGWAVSDTTDVKPAGTAFTWNYAGDKTLTAQLNLNVYTISYTMNSGTNYSGAPTSYTYGTGATISGTPTRTGHTFAGWCTDSGLTNCAMSQTISTTDTGNKAFYAKWTPNVYTISYTMNGGTNYANAPTQYTYGTTTYINGTPTKDGNTFLGWCTDSGLTSCAMSQTISSTATVNKTFYAKWGVPVTVTYSCGDGTGDAPTSVTATSGTTFTPATNTCTKEGYYFAGWKVDGTDTYIGDTSVTWSYTENKTLTAQWFQEKFSATTVSLSANTTVYFMLSAIGTFYVDWGDGSGMTIVRTGTSITSYSHKYTTAGVKTIRFGGRATGYNTGTSTAAISFYSSYSSSYSLSYKIASVTGSLSEIFPYITTIEQTGAQPRFYYTFYNATNLTTVPDTLFKDYTIGSSYMFYYTFNNCTGLTSIPAGLFNRITTSATYMFAYTFYYCTKLASLPMEGLFSGIKNASTYLFRYTFYYCSKLAGYIPPNTFAGLTAAGHPTASYMFQYTFYNTALVSNCATYDPTYEQYLTGYEGSSDSSYYLGGKVSCQPSAPVAITLSVGDGATAADPSTIYLQYNTGWYSDSAGTTSISSLTTVPTKSGLTFAGFFTGENGTGTKIIDEYGDILPNNLTFANTATTLYAHFLTSYTVTYSCGSDTTGDAPANGIAFSGESFTPADNNTCAKTGYTFNGWNDGTTDRPAGTAFTWNYNENKTFTAQWIGTPYNITLNNVSALPSGYTQLEYIQNSGTQYINTGVVPNQDTRVIAEFMAPSNNSDGFIFGSRESGSSRTFGFLYTALNTMRFDYAYTNTGTSGITPVFGQKLTVDVNRNKCDVYNELGTNIWSPSLSYNTFAAPNNLVFPGTMTNGTYGAGNLIIRMYSFKIYDNGTLIRDYIPAKRNSDNAIGMYDTVNNTFYPNSGTGTFTAGNPATDSTTSTYTVGVGATINEVPTRDGYTFAGWCTDAELTNCAMTQTIGTSDTGDKTFYAKWVETGSTAANIIYELNGGTNYSGAPTSYEYGTGATINGTPTKSGYTFAGWCTDSALTSCAMTQTIGTSDTGDKTFYAKWTEAAATTYNITYTMNDGTNYVNAPTTYTSGTGVTIDGTPTRTGYTFAGWTGSNGNTPQTTVTIGVSDTGDKSYTANWSQCQACAGNTGVSCSLSVVNNVCTYTTACETGYDNIQNNGAYNASCTEVGSCTVPDFETIIGNTVSSAGATTYHDGTSRGGDIVTYGISGEPDAFVADFSSLGYLIYGHGRCSSEPGTNNNQTWSNPTIKESVSENLSGRYCYCKIDSYKQTGNETQCSLSSTWVFGYDYASSTCDGNCVTVCGAAARGSGNWIKMRGHLFGAIQTPSSPAVYNITYTMNDGTNYNNAPTTYTYGTGATIDGTPTKSGYTFAGWCTDSALTNCAMTQTIGTSDTGDKTFYAKWVETVVTCSAGTYLRGSDATCQTCPAGSYCAGVSNVTDNGSDQGITSCSTATSGLYTNSAAGATTQDQCYRDCTTSDIAYSSAVTGVVYADLTNTCEVTTCSTGATLTASVTLPDSSTAPSSYQYRSHDGAYNSNADNDLSKGEWKVLYTSGATQGTLWGTGSCNGTTGDYGTVWDNDSSNWLRSSDTFTNSANGANCWCQITGWTPSNGDKQSFVSDWAFAYAYGSASNCALVCTYYCGYNVQGESSLRAGLFGSVVASGSGSSTCEPNTYNVTYVMDDGTNYNNAPTSYEYGTGATINGTPTKSGYTFAGWCTDSALTSCAMTQTIGTSDTGDKTFYAQWVETVVTCSAGTYLPMNANSCATCTANSYCGGGDYTPSDSTDQGIVSCASGLFAPAGMWESAQCGRILHVGDGFVYLRATKKTEHALHVDLDHDGVADYFGNMTTLDVPMSAGTERKLKVRYNNTTYSIYDDSVELPNQ